MSRYVVLAEGAFDAEWAKTAASLIRYRPERVVSVLDSTRAGSPVSEILGFGGAIPVLANLDEALALEPTPTALLIGIAPQGGGLPEAWRPVLRTAIEAGLDVWSGLHAFLSTDPEFSALAARRGVQLHDLRLPPAGLPVGTGRARDTSALRVLTVGTDCNVGKMTASLELVDELERGGVRAAFAATGQTGILIAGKGIAVDAVVADFVAGAAERLILESAPGADVVVVEGQGSLLHPGYSGVTLGLMHGAMPQALVLCTKPARTHIYGGEYDWVAIPPLDEVVRLYEEAMAWAYPDETVRVAAIALNTDGQADREARGQVERAEDLTSLPATDPIRFGAAKLADAITALLDV